MEDCIYINMMFQEEYKSLDKLCKECYSSTDGVSEYIRQMETQPYSVRKFIVSWEDDYRTLKHVRWIRNQLAHEPNTLNSEICKKEDLDFVKKFYDRIMDSTDPLTQIRNRNANIKKREVQEEHCTTFENVEVNYGYFTKETITKNTAKPKGNKKSVFSRIAEKIKKFFS